MLKLFQGLSKLLANYTSIFVIGVAVFTFFFPHTFDWVRGTTQTVILGIIMLTSFAVGGQTPPVGMTLFVGASIAKISIERLSIASIPYILTLVVMLVIIAFVPQLSLCLI